MPTPSPTSSSFEAGLAALETEIRKSVAQEDFAHSQELLEQYREAIEHHVRDSACGEEERLPLMGRTQRFLEWVRRMTLVNRARYQARLSALRDAGSYLAGCQGAAAEPRLRLKG